MNNYDLKNKISIITGGAGLLGVQHAQSLLEIQSTVILIDIDYKKLLNAKKHFNKINKDVFIFQSDITNETQMKKTLVKIIKKFKKVDVLVNNAAIDYKPNKKKLKKILLKTQI